MANWVTRKRENKLNWAVTVEERAIRMLHSWRVRWTQNSVHGQETKLGITKETRALCIRRHGGGTVQENKGNQGAKKPAASSTGMLNQHFEDGGHHRWTGEQTAIEDWRIRYAVSSCSALNLRWPFDLKPLSVLWRSFWEENAAALEWGKLH